MPKGNHKKAEQREMPAKWRIIADGEVNLGLSFAEAGMQEIAGPDGKTKPLYSKYYIRTNAYQAIRQDARYCKHVEELREERAKNSKITRELVEEHILWGLAESKKDGNKTAHATYATLAGKAVAMYTDKSQQVHAQEEVKELDAKEQEEAAKLVTLRLRGTG